MRAVRPIAEGERLFCIPDDCVLSPRNSRIAKALAAEGLLDVDSSDLEPDTESDDSQSESDDDEQDLSCPNPPPVVSDRTEESDHLGEGTNDLSGSNEDDRDVEGASEDNDNDSSDEEEDAGQNLRWAPLLLSLVSEYTCATKVQCTPWIAGMGVEHCFPLL